MSKAYEKAYVRACGKYAEALVIGNTERLAFWWARKVALEREVR